MSRDGIDAAAVHRLVWLLAVPIASSFVPWLVFMSNLGTDNIGTRGMGALGAVPLIGALASGVYGLIAAEQVRSWPLAPYALGAGAFLFALIDAMRTISGDGLEYFGVILVGFPLPILAIAGGLISYVWVGPPERT